MQNHGAPVDQFSNPAYLMDEGGIELVTQNTSLVSSHDVSSSEINFSSHRSFFSADRSTTRCSSRKWFRSTTTRSRIASCCLQNSSFPSSSYSFIPSFSSFFMFHLPYHLIPLFNNITFFPQGRLPLNSLLSNSFKTLTVLSKRCISSHFCNHNDFCFSNWYIFSAFNMMNLNFSCIESFYTVSCNI